MLPQCHKNVFNYLAAFLRELLKNSASNRLDVNILGKAKKQVTLQSLSLVNVLLIAAALCFSQLETKTAMRSENERQYCL